MENLLGNSQTRAQNSIHEHMAAVQYSGEWLSRKESGRSDSGFVKAKNELNKNELNIFLEIL